MRPTVFISGMMCVRTGAHRAISRATLFHSIAVLAWLMRVEKLPENGQSIHVALFLANMQGNIQTEIG